MSRKISKIPEFVLGLVLWVDQIYKKLIHDSQEKKIEKRLRPSRLEIG